MTFIINIVIGCLIAIAIAAALIAAGVFLFIRKALAECNHETTPLTIHLHEDLAPDWLKSKQAKELTADFSNLGFKPGKPYTVAEMEQVEVFSLFHKKYCGVIYNISGMGYFFDIVHETPDGEMTTVTTTPFAEVFDGPPGMQKIFLKDATLAEAFRTIEQICEHRASRTFGDANFRESVESFYKKEQAHRNRNGGVSFSEYQQVANMENKKRTDQHIRDSFVRFKTDELENWCMSGIEEYFDTNNVPEDDQYCCCYILVPNKTDPTAFVHYLSNYDMINEEDVEAVGLSFKDQNNIFQLFDTINESRSPELRAKEKGNVSFPVEGKIYQIAV